MITSTQDLSKEDLVIIINNFVEIDEELVGARKGIIQTRYIISVEGTYYCNKDDCDKPIPEHLTGFWMQEYEVDNRYDNCTDCLNKGCNFVKCYEKKIETCVWEKI